MFTESAIDRINYPDYVSNKEAREIEDTKIEQLRKEPKGNYDLDYVAQCL